MGEEGTDTRRGVHSEFDRFGKVVKLLGFKPFTSAANALEQINSISEGAARLHGSSLSRPTEAAA